MKSVHFLNGNWSLFYCITSFFFFFFLLRQGRALKSSALKNWWTQYRTRLVGKKALTCQWKKSVTAILLPFGSSFWALYQNIFVSTNMSISHWTEILSKHFFWGLCSPCSSWKLCFTKMTPKGNLNHCFSIKEIIIPVGYSSTDAIFLCLSPLFSFFLLSFASFKNVFKWNLIGFCFILKTQDIGNKNKYTFPFRTF